MARTARLFLRLVRLPSKRQHGRQGTQGHLGPDPWRKALQEHSIPTYPYKRGVNMVSSCPGKGPEFDRTGH